MEKTKVQIIREEAAKLPGGLWSSKIGDIIAQVRRGMGMIVTVTDVHNAKRAARGGRSVESGTPPKSEMVRVAARDVPGGLANGDDDAILAAVRAKYGVDVNRSDIYGTRSQDKKTAIRDAKAASGGTTRRGEPMPAPKPAPAAARVVEPEEEPVRVATPKPSPSVLVADLRLMIDQWGWEEVRKMIDVLGPTTADSDEKDE